MVLDLGGLHLGVRMGEVGVLAHAGDDTVAHLCPQRVFVLEGAAFGELASYRPAHGADVAFTDNVVDRGGDHRGVVQLPEGPL